MLNFTTSRFNQEELDPYNQNRLDREAGIHRLITGERKHRQCVPQETSATCRDNTEMCEFLAERKREKQELIDRDGCCGGEPMFDGMCFGMGWCPRVAEIRRCVSFVKNYLTWLESITGEACV